MTKRLDLGWRFLLLLREYASTHSGKQGVKSPGQSAQI